MLRAKPGRSGSRRAVQVTDAIEPGTAETLVHLAGSTPPTPSGTPTPADPDAELTRSLGEVPVRVWAELGRARTSLATIVGLGAGAVVELDRRIDDPIYLFVNGLRFAQGSLLITEDEEWALCVEEVTGMEGGA